MAAYKHLDTNGRQHVYSLGPDKDAARSIFEARMKDEIEFRERLCWGTYVKHWWEDENTFVISYCYDIEWFTDTYIFDENDNNIYC